LGNRTWLIVIAIIAVGFVVTTVFLRSDISALQNENQNLTEENQQLKQQADQTDVSNDDTSSESSEQGQNNDSTDESSGEENNTLQEDLTFVVKSVYEVMDRKDLYDKIGSSLTDNMTKQLFGEKEFEEKEQPKNTNEGKTESKTTKEVQNINFYGKYVSDQKYSAVVLFDLHTESGNVSNTESSMVQIEAEEQSGTWYVTKLESLK